MIFGLVIFVIVHLAFLLPGNLEISVENVSNNQIGYLDGVSSNIQHQLNNIASNIFESSSKYFFSFSRKLVAFSGSFFVNISVT